MKSKMFNNLIYKKWYWLYCAIIMILCGLTILFWWWGK